MMRWLLPFLLILNACAPRQTTQEFLPLNSELRLDFGAKDIRTDRPITLGRSLTKTTMVHFWATWCPQCLDELNSLRKLHEKLAGPNFRILAVALASDDEKIKHIVTRLALPFEVWSDKTGEGQHRFNAASLPYTALLDSNGKLLRFSNPQNGELVTAVSGPAVWDTPQVTEKLAKIINR